MKTNLKKTCTAMVTIAMIGAVSAAVFATDQPGKFNYGNENSFQEHMVTTFDGDGNILDQDGNIIGNVKDLPEAPKDLTIQASTFGDENAENADYFITMTDGDGNILDQDGNIIGNINDLPEVPEGMKVDIEARSMDGAEAAGEQMYSTITMTDGEGNILDAQGNIIGNIKDLPEVPEGMKVDVEVDSTDGEKAVEGTTRKAITINDNGDVVDEDGNIIGHVSL